MQRNTENNMNIIEKILFRFGNETIRLHVLIRYNDRLISESNRLVKKSNKLHTKLEEARELSLRMYDERRLGL